MGERKKHDYDRRLLGTWRSDRRRTFQHFKPSRGISPQRLRKFKSLFGKFAIRWGRGRYYWELNGHRDSEKYEVVASDSESVVIRSLDKLTGERQLRQIYFDGDHYFVVAWGMIEWFRRAE